MTDQQNPLDEVDRIYTSPDPSIDFVRLQIGFWEKLIVLDAATLAASFTAIGMFRDHLVGDGGGGGPTGGLEALVLRNCLVPVGAMAGDPGSHCDQRALLRYEGAHPPSKIIETATVGARHPATPSVRTDPIRDRRGSPHGFVRRPNTFLGLPVGLGSLGLLSSICAFYWLYRFAQANLSRPGRCILDHCRGI